MGQLVGVRDRDPIRLGQSPPLTQDEMATISQTQHNLLTLPVSLAGQRLRNLRNTGAVIGHQDIENKIVSLLQSASGPGTTYIIAGQSKPFEWWMEAIQKAASYLAQANQLMDQLESGAPPPTPAPRPAPAPIVQSPAPAPVPAPEAPMPNGRTLEQLPSVAQYRAWINNGGQVVRDAPFRSPGGASGAFDTDSLTVHWRADPERSGVARVTRAEGKAIPPTAPEPPSTPGTIPENGNVISGIPDLYLMGGAGILLLVLFSNTQRG